MGWAKRFLARHGAGNLSLVVEYYNNPQYSPSRVKRKIKELESNSMFLTDKERAELELLYNLQKARNGVPGSKYPGGQYQRYKTLHDANEELQE
jgi:hypothetical protein